MIPAINGTAIFTACLLIPLIGCILAVTFQSILWLILLIPLMVFMEGGIFLIALAIVVVGFLVGN